VQWARGERRIKSASPNGCEILKPDASAPDGFRAPKEGEIMKNPTLANTFKLLGEHGKKGFYEGAVAEAIIKETAVLGGRFTLDDLKHHCEVGTENTEPISLRFNALGVNEERGGLDVWEHPPNGQGIVALMTLGILKELEKNGKVSKWSREQHNSVTHLHPIIEALRLSFSDAAWFVTDPNVTKVPTAGLLSPAYLADRAASYDSKAAILDSSLRHGSPAFSSSDTVYFTVTDEQGNACSFINSNYEGFGTAIVPKGCGFTLQNRGSNFSLQSNHPNVYAPRKRPYHTIIPALATHADTGELVMSFGVMGGFMQPQGHVQVLLNIFAFGMDPQAALDAPRICIGPGMPDEDGNVSGQVVSIEEGVSEETVEALRKMGHNVQVVAGYGRGLFGRGQIILARKDDGRTVYSAGSDGRADGAALPLL
jgi:gamma-glutamyltranspeptidase/glutathione hydrolase